MGSLRGRFINRLRSSLMQHKFLFDLQRFSRVCLSTSTLSGFADKEIDDTGFLYDQKELEPQGVDPRKGWNFRGVHKAIICGKLGQPPVQKILRNGKTITIFTVGTGGMFDQRIVGTESMPRPVQWHRITVHNEILGAYAVQQLAKNSAVFVEGDIETRVYNDSITGQVKNVPEVCVRRDDSPSSLLASPKFCNIIVQDLTSRIAPHLDRHPVFLILEFIQEKQLYTDGEILNVKIDLLSQTNMVYHTMDIHMSLYRTEYHKIMDRRGGGSGATCLIPSECKVHELRADKQYNLQMLNDKFQARFVSSNLVIKLLKST